VGFSLQSLTRVFAGVEVGVSNINVVLLWQGGNGKINLLKVLIKSCYFEK